METVRRTYRVQRKDINYLRTTLESYDGMAMVRTLDPREAVIEVSVSPGCVEPVLELLEDLKRSEGMTIRHAPPEGPGIEEGEASSGTFFIHTMGCQMNEYDSDYAARCLIQAGYRRSRTPDRADILVVNSCSVREKAEHKAISTLGRMAGIKRGNPACVIVFAGCVAQQEGDRLLDRFSQLDIVIGTRQVGRIAEAVAAFRGDRRRRALTALETSACLPAPPKSDFFEGRVKGFITIMQGCDNFCSYCIVPHVRGREISRSPEEILAEARELLGQGIREITLLGQNVNSYRWNTSATAVTFPDLLRLMDDLEGLERLRFTTSHPKDLSEDLIECFPRLKTLCGHLHLPFQAGSNRVLKRMNRRYTREHYLGLVARLRMACPDIALTADVMVGFPGENQEDFEETLDLIRRVRFANLYSFKYSDRKGTAAARMEGKVDDREKGRRLKILQDIQRDITLEGNRSLEGKTVEVLVEGASKRGGQVTGRTGSNLVVNFDGNLMDIGKIVKVKVYKGFANSIQAVKID